MRGLIFVLFFHLVVISNAQPDITYIDKEGRLCSKENAWHKREVVIEGEDSVYHIREYDPMFGSLQMEAYCTSINPVVFNGLCTYYHSNGKKRMETTFKKNQSTGWQYWTEKGEGVTRTSAADKIYKDTTIFRLKDVTDTNFKSAEFPGGDIGFGEYIMDEIEYPRVIAWRRISDKLHIAFMIDSTGKLRNVHFSNRMGTEFETQVKKVLASSPLWRPATYAGKSVNTCVLFTINFMLAKER